MKNPVREGLKRGKIISAAPEPFFSKDMAAGRRA